MTADNELDSREFGDAVDNILCGMAAVLLQSVDSPANAAFDSETAKSWLDATSAMATLAQIKRMLQPCVKTMGANV